MSVSWIPLWLVLRTPYSPNNETFTHLGVAEMSGRAATTVLKMQVVDICWECIKRLVESLGMSNPIHSSINAREETRGNITALEHRDQRLSPPWTRFCLLPWPRQKFKDSYTWPDSTEHSPDPPPPLHHFKMCTLGSAFCFLIWITAFSMQYLALWRSVWSRWSSDGLGCVHEDSPRSCVM